MNKGTHFLGQPLYCQALSLLNKPAVLQYSCKHSGEHYVKSFDAWTHLAVMLYAVIHRFDSLREITASLQADARKLSHLGICNISARSTLSLSDANRRRPQAIFADTYRDLYARYRPMLSSDSRVKPKEPQWMKRLQIIDSTTITLFSNLILQGGAQPQKRQEERRDKGTYGDSCQRGSPF